MCRLGDRAARPTMAPIWPPPPPPPPPHAGPGALAQIITMRPSRASISSRANSCKLRTTFERWRHDYCLRAGPAGGGSLNGRAEPGDWRRRRRRRPARLARCRSHRTGTRCESFQARAGEFATRLRQFQRTTSAATVATVATSEQRPLWGPSASCKDTGSVRTRPRGKRLVVRLELAPAAGRDGRQQRRARKRNRGARHAGARQTNKWRLMMGVGGGGQPGALSRDF